MRLRSDGFPARALVTVLAIAWAAGIGLAAGRAPTGRGAAAVPVASITPTHAAAPAPLPAAAQATGFVGDETCSTCHEPEGKGLHLTLHGKAQNTRTPAAKTGMSCETCHGPGQAHVDTGDKTKIKRFTAMSAKDVNATCLTCHSKGSHAQWNGGMHDARNVSCASCHSVHNPKSERAQLKTVTAVQTCETCHKQEAMKVKKSGHMPVREGKMDCTTCHTPHGSTNVRMLKVGNTINETCASCHSEKRGPFLHDHAAGRESCATCHDHADELRRTRRSLKLDQAIVAASGENRDLGDGLVRFIAAPRPVGTLPAFANYSDGHPPFGYEQPGSLDPGDLKFNHARHLRGDLPAVKKGKLDCATCHQPGPGGVFDQPIRYEKHCQECHSLQIQPSLPQLRVPHGDPEKARYFLASLGTSFDAALRADGLTDPTEIARRVEIETQALRRRGLNTLEDLERRVFLEGDPRDDATTRLMRAGNPKFLTECAKCHTVTPGGANHAPIVHPPHLAERWVQRGPFTHLPHEHMACADCHGAASKSKLTSDILLPPQALCAECHRPQAATAAQPWEAVKTSTAPTPHSPALAAAQRSAGGVKWDCQSCHTFHAPPDATAATK